MYCKLDPTFKSHVMNYFSEENDPENESSNYSVRGYRGGMRRRAGRGRGRGRSKSRSLSLQRSLTSLYSQSGCSYSWAVKKQLAKQYFSFDDLDTSSIDDYKAHAAELSVENDESESEQNDEDDVSDYEGGASDRGSSDSVRSAVYARSKNVINANTPKIPSKPIKQRS